MTRSDSNGSVSPRQLLGRIALTGAIAYGAGTLGLASYLVRRVTVRPRSHRPAHFSFTPWEFGLPYEPVTIPIPDGHLSGWFLPQPNHTAPAILGLAGHGGTKSDLLGICGALHASGFACLMFDFRGAGQSSDTLRTLGHRETIDARLALDWLSQRVEGPVGALGFSMGGSIAIQLAGTDNRIRAVVADSAFASQYGVLAHIVRSRTRLPHGPVMALAEPLFWLRHRHWFADFAPESVIGDIAPRPTLLIHPTEDRLVPISEADRLWEAAREPKERWIAEGLPHCGAYFQDRDAYCRRVTAFFRSALI